MKSQSERRRDALKQLVVARQADGDPALALVYLQRLEDIEAGVLERVCYAIGNEPTAPYQPRMPEVGEIRRRCEALASREALTSHLLALPPAPVSDEDGPRYYCLDCHDGDWGAATWCPGTDNQPKHPRHAHAATAHCGRVGPHAAHTCVGRCHCWGRNAVVERRRLAKRSGDGRAA